MNSSRSLLRDTKTNEELVSVDASAHDLYQEVEFCVALVYDTLYSHGVYQGKKLNVTNHYGFERDIVIDMAREKLEFAMSWLKQITMDYGISRDFENHITVVCERIKIELRQLAKLNNVFVIKKNDNFTVSCAFVGDIQDLFATFQFTSAIVRQVEHGRADFNENPIMITCHSKNQTDRQEVRIAILDWARECLERCQRDLEEKYSKKNALLKLSVSSLLERVNATLEGLAQQTSGHQRDDNVGSEAKAIKHATTGLLLFFSQRNQSAEQQPPAPENNPSNQRRSGLS